MMWVGFEELRNSVSQVISSLLHIPRCGDSLILSNISAEIQPYQPINPLCILPTEHKYLQLGPSGGYFDSSPDFPSFRP